MGKIAFAELFLLPLFLAIPAFILYFVIKLAVKHAIKELKDNNII
jgi:LytS/YehU family sensor histidine kinase